MIQNLTGNRGLWETLLMTTSYIPEIYKDFTKAVEWLGRRHSISTVFNDLLTMGICSFHETNIMSRLTQKDEANEALYMETIKRYDREELNQFAKMIGMVKLNAYEAPYSDMLGQYFTEHITRGHNGQYFTPDAICQLMAQMQGEKESITGKRVADPSCGSSRLLLEFARNNPDNTFYGADNANTCAKMSAINFFINGLKGEVAWMNTLSMEWYGGWHINRYPRIGIVPVEKEQSAMWWEPKKTPEPPEDIKSYARPDGQQLMLF